MSTLTNFLNSEAQKQRERRAEIENARKDWIQAVKRLIDTMKEWLRASDSHHLLELEEKPVELLEERFGRYEASGLSIFLGGRRVEVIPRGLAVLGTVRQGPESGAEQIHGLVDLTDGLRKYRLLRLKGNDTERWAVMMTDRLDQLTPWDRETFEIVLVSMLQ